MSTKDNSSYSNPVLATFNGIADLFRHKEPIGEIRDSDRLDGLICLVTGANSGLGKAIAVDFARRGGHVIMACRSGIPEAGNEVKAMSGSDKVEMLSLDLADIDAILASCAELKQRGIQLDRVVLNAGLVPQKPLKTRQGYEMMFGVHALGNRVLVQQLLLDGTIRNSRFATQANVVPGKIPRIVFVSSETHRSGTPIELDTLGQPVEYSAMGSIAQYGHSKLVMTNYAVELSRRLNPQDEVEVAVHALCPGPINSNIAREAPRAFKPVLKAIMGLLFASPEKAARPAIYLSSSPDIEGQTGLYLHLMVRKDAAQQALDPQLGQEVWERMQQMIQSHQHSGASHA